MKTSLLTFVFLITSILLLTLPSHSQEKTEYVCYPCGGGCDKVIHHSNGICSECEMTLIEKSKVIFKNIDTPEFLSKLENEKRFILLDVRSAEEFNGNGKGQRSLHGYKHLINAVNLSSDILEENIGEIMKYKDSEVIVYCSHSRRSPFCSQILTDAGFINVTNYSGGIAEFVEEYLINSNSGKDFIVK
ncbi:MAG: rhodanese-like domain-containing protein [Ignavibacteria bacterium]